MPRLGLLCCVLIICACGVVPAGPPQPGLSPADPTTCRGFPHFATSEGLSQQTIISTRDTTQLGLVLRDPESKRVVQRESWDDAGAFGAFVLDAAGSIYLAPTPRISLSDNPAALQNRVYKIDTERGELELFADLPAAAPVDASQNPFGVMGLFVACESASLYLSSLAGSTRSRELGQIARLDLHSGAVTSHCDGIDAIGVGVYGDVLIIGRARQASLWAVPLDAHGDLRCPPLPLIDLAAQLNDGGGRVRRMFLDPQGHLVLMVAPFSYTLEPAVSREQRLWLWFEAGRWIVRPEF